MGVFIRFRLVSCASLQFSFCLLFCSCVAIFDSPANYRRSLFVPLAAMLFSASSVILVASLLGSIVAASSYAPSSVSCPSTLVRVANGLSTDEQAWKTARKTIADTALRAWLKKTNAAFETTGTLPTLGLSISGGGYRAFLTGAGIIQAMDINDSTVSTSGLYQGISYTSALSGGSWLLSSLADNNFPTVSSILASQWDTAFENGLFAPNGLLAIVAYAAITTDILAKETAGYNSTLTDLWGRLLSYQLLAGSNGGVASTLSGLASKSAFVNHKAPYPIITSLNTNLNDGSCSPFANASVWEFTPFETGSWAERINAFTPSKYLGTTVSNGKATTCKNGFDNLGFVLGTSSMLFNNIAAATSIGETVDTFCSAAAGMDVDTDLGKAITALLTLFPNLTADLENAVDAFYALYPNPFYQLSSAAEVSSQPTLRMVDGGESGQTSPIFPHLLPERNVSLVIVNDNNGDAADLPSYPNGTAIYSSYVQAKAAGLTRMPLVPAPIDFLANYTSGAPIFFGCNDASVVTLIWVPNVEITYPSGINTITLQTSKSETEAMIANGKAIGSRSDSKEWATCLGCTILDAGALTAPAICTACFEQYCYVG